MKNLMSTNIYDVEETVIEETHINMAITKIAEMLRTERIKNI